MLLIWAYTGIWIERDDWRSQMTPEGKRAFMWQLALKMFNKGGDFSLHYSQLDRPDRNHLKDSFEVKDKDYYKYETTTCSFLNRNQSGQYKFIHKSFMEYFLAEHFFDSVTAKKDRILSYSGLNQETRFFLKLCVASNKADLYGLDLNGLDLQDIDLTEARFRGSDLSKANLSSVNLRGTDLKSVNLSGADLRATNLKEAVNVRQAVLHGATLSGLDLSGLDLRGADLSGSDLSKADLNKANLWRANLSEADLVGANLSDANLNKADLSRADLRSAYLLDAKLYRAFFFETKGIF